MLATVAVEEKAQDWILSWVAEAGSEWCGGNVDAKETFCPSESMRFFCSAMQADAALLSVGPVSLLRAHELLQTLNL